MGENATLAFVNIEGNACAAGVSLIRVSDDHRIVAAIATHRYRLKARCADSESPFLAMKKFSRFRPSRLIGAGPNRFFARIVTADSWARFPGAAVNHRSFGGEQCSLTRLDRRRADNAGHDIARHSDAKFGLEQIVHGLRIGLAAG
ncbi:hypothetical protein [Bradyrhizobium canariense]|uniref:hypothetical protein n=1 Tax=Bradyrhizobium canariense TaxID=255045 RepID=UPI0011BA516B|nr:hypothetical protein [Bradyrhizobium canariense]